MYTHSYTEAKAFDKKCKISGFECKNEDSLVVHLGKCKSENFECGYVRENLIN